MTIEIKVTKKHEEEFDTDMLEITAETSYPGKEITFYLDGNHLATTMTDTEGKAIAGISYSHNTKFVFEVECNEEHETREYKTR